MISFVILRKSNKNCLVLLFLLHDHRQSKFLHHGRRQSKFSERAVLFSYKLQGTGFPTRKSRNDKTSFLVREEWQKTTFFCSMFKRRPHNSWAFLRKGLRLHKNIIMHFYILYIVSFLMKIYDFCGCKFEIIVHELFLLVSVHMCLQIKW